MSIQNHTNEVQAISEVVTCNESSVVDAVGSEKNVNDKAQDCSDVKELASTIKNENINKLDILEISSEGNVTHQFNDGTLKESDSIAENDTKKEIIVDSNNISIKNEKEKSNHGPEYFVSSDPQENADNNNPEWDLLRKLQTDEERYKAVRMRWKNLVIPNPNQNMSYRSGGFKKPIHQNDNNISSRNVTKSRKRTLSDTREIGIGNEPKRARTMSCTALFDQKVQKLHNSMNNTIRRIENNAQQAVNDLHCRQTWSFMYRPPGSRAEEVYREAVHIQNVVELRRQYERRVIDAMKEGEEEILALRKAMEEVHAFNSFYQGLEPGLENTIYLTASELEELVEEDKLYEDFNKFYK